MVLDGKVLLARLAKLSEVKTIKDVPQLTHALFPGTHCPLMGAAMAAGGIDDSLIVVIGTDECAYYTKSMTISSDKFGGLAGRCISIVLDNHDVTFGSLDKVMEDFAEIVREYKPGCVFLVTTCVVEIIGDDFDTLADNLSKKYNLPVMAVHTEHFKCEDHLPGLERTITACGDMMTKLPANSSVNVLGQRLGVFATTELFKVLTGAGVKVGLQLPSGCSAEEIKKAGAAKVNIVVNDIALPLAELMKEKLGIPYVNFNRYASPERIFKAYKELFAFLELPLSKEISEKYLRTKDKVEAMKPIFKDFSFIYGNTPYACFEFNSFLISLGMISQLIQTNRMVKNDEELIREILEQQDPFICKAANIAPLTYIYDELHPCLYIGHEFAPRLREKGTAILHTDAANAMLGFECTDFLLDMLAEATAEAKEYRKEVGL